MSQRCRCSWRRWQVAAAHEAGPQPRLRSLASPPPHPHSGELYWPHAVSVCCGVAVDCGASQALLSKLDSVEDSLMAVDSFDLDGCATVQSFRA